MGICQFKQHPLHQNDAYPMSQMQKREMKHPYCVKPCPIDMTLEVGKQYQYCTCGLSKSQPFCDGSHQGTLFLPLKFTPEHSICFLCLCKKTKNPPYCDNSHKKHQHDYDF